MAGVRLSVPIGLVCVPIACIALWLTTAVALAQGDGPGITSGVVTQVAKPVVKQVGAATSSAAATAQRATSNASTTAQHAAATAQRAVSAAQAATASQPVHKPVPTVQVPAVPVPAADIPTTPQLPAAPPQPISPTVPEVVDVPAAATTVEDIEVVADDVVTDDIAIPPAPEPLDTSAVPPVASAAIRQVESVVDTAAEQVISEIAPGPPAAATEPSTPVASREPIPSHEGSRSAPRASAAFLEPSALIAPNIASSRSAERAPKPASRPTLEIQTPSAPLAERGAHPRPASVTDNASAWRAPSAGPSPRSWSVLGAAQSLRFVDARAASSSLNAQPGLGRSAFTANVLLVVPNTAPAFDTSRPRQSPEWPSPFDALALHGGASAPPAASPSSLLLDGGGGPGAASPAQLSLLLLTAWRSLWRHRTSHPASIALPSLAPPG